MATWNEKVQAWQEKESAELLAQHRETTAAMKALAMESEMRHKEHIAKMKAYWQEHGVGPQRTYSSGGSFANKTR